MTEPPKESFAFTHKRVAYIAAVAIIVLLIVGIYSIQFR
jgi:hypothetical protein